MDHGLHREEPAAGSVSIERERARRGIDVLRREPARLVPARRRLRAQNPARHQASRYAGGAGEEVRSRGQPENRQGTRDYVTARDSRPRRRGDRMIGRREFITLFGGAAAWPLAARAAGKRPRVAVLTLLSSQDERGRIVAFIAGMREMGYIAGQTFDIDYRY